MCSLVRLDRYSSRVQKLQCRGSISSASRTFTGRTSIPAECAAACNAAEQGDEIAALQLIELHSVPAAKPDCRISNWETSVSGYLDSTPAVACCNVFPDFVEACLPSQVTKPPAGPDWIHEIKHDGLACHHVQTCTDREQPTRKIVRRRQTRTSRAHSKKWHAAGCYLPSKWSGWTVRKRPKRATLPRSQEPLLIK